MIHGRGRSDLKVVHCDLQVGDIMFCAALIHIGMLDCRIERHPDCFILEFYGFVHCVSLVIQTVEVGKLEAGLRRRLH